MKFLLPCLLLFAALCLNTTAHATSVGTLDGSPVNLPPGMLIENRAMVSPLSFVSLLLMAELLSLFFISLPTGCYAALRRRWPQQPKFLQLSTVILLLLLAAYGVMFLTHGTSRIRLQDILAPFLSGAFGYGIIKLTDFLVIRHLWRRFARLPRRLRPVAAFVLPILLVWLAALAQQALIRATMTTYAYPHTLPVPQIRQGTPTPPPPPNAPPDQPSASPPPHLTLPPEALQ